MAMYEIQVFEREYDSDDVPFVNGIIELTDTQYRTLDHQLYRFVGEDIIGKYNIERYEVPSVFAPEGVLNFIVGLDNDEGTRERRALWARAGVEVTA